MGTQNHLIEAVLTSTHNLCFEQKYEKYQIFLSENFQFLVVKFSIYLNRHVFVMYTRFSHRVVRLSPDSPGDVVQEEKKSSKQFWARKVYKSQTKTLCV